MWAAMPDINVHTVAHFHGWDFYTEHQATAGKGGECNNMSIIQVSKDTTALAGCLGWLDAANVT